MASPEITLQSTIKSAIEALTYINANSIPVRNWDDQDDARALPCVLVRVVPRERLAPNYNFYKMPVEISCLRHRGDDPNGTGIDSIYSAISAWANGTGSYIRLNGAQTITGSAAAGDAMVRASNGDGSAWTIAMRLYLTGSGGSQWIFTYGDILAGYISITWQAGTMTFFYGSSGGNISKTFTVSANAWHQVVIAFDGGLTGNTIGNIQDYYDAFTVWVDGAAASVSNANTAAGYTGAITASTFAISGINSSSYMADGSLVSDVAIWSSDQTANIKTIYNGGAPSDLSSLAPQSFYRFNDQTTPTAPNDAIGYKDLVASGATKSQYSEGKNITPALSADGVTHSPGTDEMIDSIHIKTVMFDVYKTIA